MKYVNLGLFLFLALACLVGAWFMIDISWGLSIILTLLAVGCGVFVRQDFLELKK